MLDELAVTESMVQHFVFLIYSFSVGFISHGVDDAELDLGSQVSWLISANVTVNTGVLIRNLSTCPNLSGRESRSPDQHSFFRSDTSSVST